ncbi:hypothetical protein J2X32_001196 [Rheinheimera pacifica]|uniref:CsiV family protein n=1 Tax=Rheinheimera pacifica TaxID=173990 RepID=UPI00285482D6|nr:CsiV family protein [Rheinheimera pacifica]MDR6982578.1 hypothetical protein [Rheinheimera pacifica]
MIKALKYCLLSSVLLTSPLSAQQQRWFEVEMLVFSQTPGAAIQETFGDSIKAIKPGRAYDLLTPRYQPDIANLLSELPLCSQDSGFASEFKLMPLRSHTMCIFEPQVKPWQQHNLFQPRNTINKVAYPLQLPTVITGRGQHQNTPYLADDSALQLRDIAQRINRQAGMSLLLHTSWRQAPVTERRAIASRWFAGKNFSQQFDYWSQPRNLLAAAADPALTRNTPTYSMTDTGSDTQLLGQIDSLLQQLSANSQLPPPPGEQLAAIAPEQQNLSSLPDQVWQLDGLFKLHLDHYLFVNTEFNLRIPSANKLNTVYVRQSRRVISGEIHYLDHPHLGIILQIRRFDPPIAE